MLIVSGFRNPFFYLIDILFILVFEITNIVNNGVLFIQLERHRKREEKEH
jgi:predicted cation transporter